MVQLLLGSQPKGRGMLLLLLHEFFIIHKAKKKYAHNNVALNTYWVWVAALFPVLCGICVFLWLCHGSHCAAERGLVQGQACA